MKFAVTFALVMLALCCDSATAKICPEFLEVLRTLFQGTISEFEAAINVFNPTQDMRTAGIELKTLLGFTLPKTREDAAKLTEKIVQSPQCV